MRHSAIAIPLTSGVCFAPRPGQPRRSRRTGLTNYPIHLRGTHMIKRTAVYGCLISFALLSGNAMAQIANGKPKFVGSAADNPAANFSTYFNQLTPENATKWGSV